MNIRVTAVDNDTPPTPSLPHAAHPPPSNVRLVILAPVPFRLAWQAWCVHASPRAISTQITKRALSPSALSTGPYRYRIYNTMKFLLGYFFIWSQLAAAGLGYTWTERPTAGSRIWTVIASSSDGTVRTVCWGGASRKAYDANDDVAAARSRG